MLTRLSIRLISKSFYTFVAYFLVRGGSQCDPVEWASVTIAYKRPKSSQRLSSQRFTPTWFFRYKLEFSEKQTCFFRCKLECSETQSWFFRSMKTSILWNRNLVLSLQIKLECSTKRKFEFARTRTWFPQYTKNGNLNFTKGKLDFSKSVWGRWWVWVVV